MVFFYGRGISKLLWWRILLLVVVAMEYTIILPTDTMKSCRSVQANLATCSESVSMAKSSRPRSEAAW
jgi:hypothetical protein